MRITAAVAALAFGVAGTAQTRSWNQLSPSGAPAGRYGVGMAFHAATQRMIALGGESAVAIGSASTELLVADWLSGSTWSTMPFPFWYGGGFAACTYDVQRQRTVVWMRSSALVFGVPVPNQWAIREWDGSNWIYVATPNYALAANAAAYDAARGQTVFFGGAYPWWSSSWSGTTWTWNGLTLAQLSPPSSPSARALHAMAYDSTRQRVVLFGGCVGATSPSSLGDTWEWDGQNWSQSNPPVSPTPRRGHAMAYDSVRQRVVLFGGASSAPSVYHDDTWEWDGTNWALVSVAARPPGRWGHAMAYDESMNRMVVFGGTFDQGPLNDTWVLFDSDIPAQATSYGQGCGSPALTLAPDANRRPVLGHVGRVTISQAPTALAGIAMGWSNTLAFPIPLPLDLSAFGLPGCYLWQSLDVFGLPANATSASTLQFDYAIPTSPSLIGGHAYLQAYCYAPGVNPGDMVLSNGVDWVVGNT
jgi:hypothetical protein